MSKATKRQIEMPGFDDLRAKKDQRARSRTRTTREAVEREPNPEHCCATCAYWMPEDEDNREWGRCPNARVMVVAGPWGDRGTVVDRPDDDRTLYGVAFEPLRTYRSFRACRRYDAAKKRAA